MNEKVKPAWDKVKGFFGGLSKGVKVVLVIILILAIGLIIGLTVYQQTRPYTILYTELNQDDMQKVLEYLGNHNVTDFRTRGEDTILVPEGKADSLKAQLAMEGYPSSGFAYGTYLKNVGTLSSESDRDRLALYELQDRLSATIEWFDGVKQATVDITVREDSRYILDPEDALPAKAAVTVIMQGNQVLTNKQAVAIRNLVAKSVQGLDFEEVALADTAGNQYDVGEMADASDASNLKLTLENQVSRVLQNKILDALVPFFGAKNVAVSVNTTVDVSRTWSESIDYIPEEGTNWDSLGGHGLIGEYVFGNSIVRDGENPAGGVPGTTTNSDLNEYMTNPGNLTGNESELGTSGTVKHENDKQTTQKETVGGVITDVSVAVSINSNAMQGNRSVLDLVGHVARSVGISPEIQNDKVSVLAWPFYEDGTEPGGSDGQNAGQIIPGVPNWILYAIVAGVLLFFVLLILILVLRSGAKKRKKARQEMEEQQRRIEELEQQQLAAIGMAEAVEGGAETEGGGKKPQGAQIMDLHSERAMELRQGVREFAEQNPEIAAQMVKLWLKGGDDRA